MLTIHLIICNVSFYLTLAYFLLSICIISLNIYIWNPHVLINSISIRSMIKIDSKCSVSLFEDENEIQKLLASVELKKNIWAGSLGNKELAAAAQETRQQERACIVQSLILSQLMKSISSSDNYTYITIHNVKLLDLYFLYTHITPLITFKLREMQKRFFINFLLPHSHTFDITFYNISMKVDVKL